MKELDRIFWWAGGVVLLFVLSINFLVPYLMKVSYSAPLTGEKFAGVTEENPADLVVHLPTPEPVKAIYMTSCVASTVSWRTHLKNLIETTELNSVIIDIKDYTGTVSFAPKNYGRGCVVSDLKEFIQELHASNIYVIGRISVFQDLYYANLHPELAVKNKSDGGVWKDHKGISFIDVGAKPYWDYIVGISQEAYSLGFDELNYDYVRYPSDGNMQNAHYSWTTGTSTKSEMLESFFSYLHEKTEEIGTKTSVDIFGMTTSTKHDLGIGQVLEKALPYFDYVSPMVYPSHYPPGWNGFQNPAANPYEVIKIAMGDGVKREQALNVSKGLATTTPSKLRPWLQDFSLGATYDAVKVRDQIRASNEVGLNSWMMWSAANKYTEAAYLRE
jgi:hypothetical protein